MSGRSGSTAAAGTPGSAAIFAAALAGVVAGACGLAAVLWLRERGTKKVEATGGSESGENLCPVVGDESSSRARAEATGDASAGRRRIPARSWHEADMTPPLPDDVVRLLQASRLCFLSTFSDDHPHLSLMNFTYYPGKRQIPVIILSTRRDTKKYKLLQTGRNVAILVHEFPESGGSCGGGGSGSKSKVTITLNGEATIQEGEHAERYRDLHVGKNPDSMTFITGPNIAIITVRVRSARICNVRDEVTVWNVGESHPGAK
ncbi:unnamed protein product [Hapterophycus canaliculatus]